MHNDDSGFGNNFRIEKINSGTGVNINCNHIILIFPLNYMTNN